MPRYYDIDDILAEEELVPCVTLFDFSYLAHLDPELTTTTTSLSTKDDGNAGAKSKQHYLPESSRIKMPLWTLEKWAMLGFVRLSLPRHFQRGARERLEAEPSEVNLRKRNERFFMSGNLLVNLIEQSSVKVAKAIASQPGRNPRRNAQIAALEKVSLEARELRTSLLSAYTGDRLRHTLDWSLSSVGEDVTSYTDKLTEMERRLFHRGAMAASFHMRWKLYGQRRRQRLAPPAATESDGSKAQSHIPFEHRDKRVRTN